MSVKKVNVSRKVFYEASMGKLSRIIVHNRITSANELVMLCDGLQSRFVVSMILDHRDGHKEWHLDYCVSRPDAETLSKYKF